MKRTRIGCAAAVMGVIAGLLSTQSHAQMPVIESLSLNGDLICTGLKSGSTATVEWAPTVNGPWTNSWAGLDAVAVGDDGTIRVKVPMFYRVRGEAQPVGPEGMVWIPLGTFTMGSPPSERYRYSDEGPQTVVTLTKGFWLGKYEVTQREYLAVMGTNPSHFTGDLDRPVETVTWHNATNYCGKLTEQERAAGRLPAGYEYRLPTEAQWEYACRAGTTTRYSFGDALECDDLCGACPIGDEYMWWCGNSGEQTHRVGQKLPNLWGLHDMHGNVYEWCADWYDSYPGGSVTDPTGPSSGSHRVYRGGSWYYFGQYCRSAHRIGDDPEYRYYYLGFRPVLVAVP
ncbi:MAG TPA: formylglycine-generating enzyme family protein [Verrucomicrobiota bacterium]|nr:formylglycine-generating enzyme family protein [Verrucomicrobiota bacterium]